MFTPNGNKLNSINVWKKLRTNKYMIFFLLEIYYYLICRSHSYVSKENWMEKSAPWVTEPVKVKDIKK